MLPLYVKCTKKFQIIFTQRFILLISSKTPTHNYFSHFQYSELTIQIIHTNIGSIFGVMYMELFRNFEA